MYSSTPFVPHITLTPCPKNRTLSTLKKISEELSGEINPPHLNTLKIDSLNNHFQSLYIQFSETEPLHKLRKSARKMVGFKKDEPYLPHLSLFYGYLTNDQRKLIKSEVADQIPDRLTFDRIALTRLNGHPENWQIEHTFFCKKIN